MSTGNRFYTACQHMALWQLPEDPNKWPASSLRANGASGKQAGWTMQFGHQLRSDYEERSGAYSARDSSPSIMLISCCGRLWLRSLCILPRMCPTSMLYSSGVRPRPRAGWTQWMWMICELTSRWWFIVCQWWPVQSSSILPSSSSGYIGSRNGSSTSFRAPG